MNVVVGLRADIAPRDVYNALTRDFGPNQPLVERSHAVSRPIKPDFRSARIARRLLEVSSGGQAHFSVPNLRAVQLLFGHTKMDSTVRYLGVELEDALAIAEAIEI